MVKHDQRNKSVVGKFILFIKLWSKDKTWG